MNILQLYRCLFDDIALYLQRNNVGDLGMVTKDNVQGFLEQFQAKLNGFSMPIQEFSHMREAWKTATAGSP